jgi:hypothetical protein
MIIPATVLQITHLKNEISLHIFNFVFRSSVNSPKASVIQKKIRYFLMFLKEGMKKVTYLDSHRGNSFGWIQEL